MGATHGAGTETRGRAWGRQWASSKSYLVVLFFGGVEGVKSAVDLTNSLITPAPQTSPSSDTSLPQQEPRGGKERKGEGAH